MTLQSPATGNLVVLSEKYIVVEFEPPGGRLDGYVICFSLRPCTAQRAIHQTRDTHDHLPLHVGFHFIEFLTKPQTYCELRSSLAKNKTDSFPAALIPDDYFSNGL
jgi:hypothetical protein